ncbi:MAG: terpene cyclase/mutase family protein [Pirellulales bacterium]|nr:terpene cyclase/mutase family protein [Pirellulales bacterium]
MLARSIVAVGGIVVGLGLQFGLGAARASDPAPSPAKLIADCTAKAVSYLSTQGQAADGSFSSAASPAVTSLVVAGLLRNGRSVDDPVVAKGLKYIEGLIQPDGGIYNPAGTNKNYETCIAMVCLAEANRDGRYAKQLAAADAFIKGLQWDEGEGKQSSDINYGGAGYGRKNRPDLSNTSFLLDALRAAGNGPEDPAVQKALIFVSRCQNLESEFNTSEFAAKNPDGGFYYTVAAGGESMAGTTDEGGLRSYGSMTYAGLKSMIFAGVGPDDPRVKAALTWIQKHYGLDQNPGMGDAGLYYYYHTFAKALAALDVPEIADADGTKHNWRHDLATALAERQRADGAWVNTNSRWLEGDANLVTAYALLALSYCREAKP